ncbi:MAG: hypothetical protein IJQ04_03055 [Prevotella sp.]|nr:hypothetical protein [Prevotella sp.]
MIKRFQNRVAESRIMLPAVSLYGIVVWLLYGMIGQHWWVQFACFALSSFLMMILNNQNALIRIYSRSVSAAFIILSCAACYLFPSFDGAIVQLCLVACLLTLYQSYQDRQSSGLTFYTFMILSLGSLFEVHTLWFLPLFWVFMAFYTYSMSTKTFLASLMGLILPYWFVTAWLLWREEGNLSYFITHFEPLWSFTFPTDYTSIPLIHYVVLAFIVILTITGMIHFIRTSYNDKIRVRQIYYTFMIINLFALAVLILQPQTEDIMLRAMILTTSPLIGHFVALTHTRITNIAFCVILAISLILTIISIWTSSLIF